MTTYVSTQVRGGGHHLLQRMSCNHERERRSPNEPPRGGSLNMAIMRAAMWRLARHEQLYEYAGEGGR